MPKESPRSIRLSAAGLAALKILTSDSPGKSQGDIVSDALTEKVNKVAPSPCIRFGTLDPKELPFLQVEAAAAERRLRELKQKILAIRVHEKNQAEKLSVVLGKVEVELAESTKFRLALAKLGRLGSELTITDKVLVGRLIEWVQKRIETEDADYGVLYKLELRILEAFVPK